ncbi:MULTISPECIES: DNA-3-methyladenine glycosylase [Salimicrobium]|uniref:Putative 3-methyladenine DNA glycosylase n=2 Tax=Salimicrobium TaxID=351195 RepID=A0ABY1KQZ4_9BACI|nr:MULTISPECIES: DNA-3-methyladenine glycosylase [Salimicrobium]SDX38314.1 DNA-3-methyladenine glycosylase [Salimicrobium album]SIS46997.1 DNA-3-methyladenine glycosylase [Salimicrobium salexigens]
MELMPASFFQQPALTLAQNLLGCELIKETEEGTASGYIVETEVYIGAVDKAAHSYNYKRTKRTEVMFGEAGHAYTYVMHTHCLVNVVAGEQGEPEAILIRAVEPVRGIDLMYKRRGDKKEKELTSGPGKLTKALGIVKNDYGHPYGEPPLYIAKGFTPEHISTGPRIGIDNSEEARDFPWRFWVTGNRFVSR